MKLSEYTVDKDLKYGNDNLWYVAVVYYYYCEDNKSDSTIMDISISEVKKNTLKDGDEWVTEEDIAVTDALRKAIEEDAENEFWIELEGGE